MVPLNTDMEETCLQATLCRDQHREKGGTTLAETLEIMSQETL